MNFLSQKTIGKTFTAIGVGLHTGVHTSVTISPAAIGSGITVQIGSGAKVALSKVSTLKTPRCTRLVDGDGNVLDTAEHLLASLAMLGITNVGLSFNGPEVPILDGCCDAWISMLTDAGIVDYAVPAEHYVVIRSVEYTEGGTTFRARPGADLLRVDIDFPHPVIGNQSVAVARDHFSSLASSRTFVLEEDVERLKAAGLANGGSLDNALVIGATAPLNPEGFRSPNECVKHKALDLLGDLYVCGRLIIGTIEASRPGHAANSGFLSYLLSSGALALVGIEALAEAA